MTPVLQRWYAVTYVRDIDASRVFYERLGFAEQLSGRGPASGWVVMAQNDQSVLLAFTLPPLPMPRLPLLFYFFFDDVDTMTERLREAGVQADHLGYPPHARGGEVRLTDPDGNTVLIGQADRAPSQPEPGEQVSPHFSLLKEAADLVRASGDATPRCQVSSFSGHPCTRNADVKLADSAGDTIWACLGHADEILVTVPAAFIATPGDGIAGFVSSRG